MQTHYEPLSDAGWQFIEEILNDKRRRKHNLRLVVGSILKVLRTGTQWRNLEPEGNMLAMCLSLFLALETRRQFRET